MASFKFITLAGVSILSLSTVAHAQGPAATPAPAATENNDEIIVQARRRDERLQDVPLVVNTVTSEQIQKLNLRDFKDVASVVPGLELRTESNGVGSSAQVRGIQFDPNAGASASVAFYQNDALVDASAVLQTMYDIGNIEVQRGPQGTLRGQATPSGSIVVTTRKPDLYRINGTVTTTANDIGTQNVNGGFNLPIIKGIAAIRVAGLFDANEGNRVTTIARSGDWRDPYSQTKSGRVSLRVEPTDWLKFEGMFQRMDRHVRSFDQVASFSLFNPGAASTTPVIYPESRQAITETPRIFTQRFDIYNWRAEVRQFGQVLIYQGAQTISDFYSRTNNDPANYISGSEAYQYLTTHTKQTTHEVRLQNETRVADLLDYVVGFYSSDLGGPNHVTSEVLGSAFSTQAISVLRSGNQSERSVFGNLTLHLGDATEISGGVRHLSLSAPLTATTISLPAIGFTLAPYIQQAKSDKGWIYSASIKHNFTPDLMIYASTGTSRRIGPNPIGDFSVQQSALERSFQNLPTETSTSYEIGLRSNLFDRKLLLNLTAYHQKFQNYAYRNPLGVYYVNYGAPNVPSVALGSSFIAPVPVEVNGIEGEANFIASRHWNIGANASYSLGKIKNGTIPCTDINGDGIPDAASAAPSLGALQAATGSNNLSTCRVTQRASPSPLFSATIRSEYNHPISDNVDGFLRGIYSFYGASQGDPSYLYDDYKAYGILNLFAGIHDPKGNWEITLYSKNLLKMTRATSIGYPLQTTYGAARSVFTSGYVPISTTIPREFGITTRFSFGGR
ncbi:MAG TPA: TonB-dependent receptor [Sphingobium sp.]|uniref:TonB-dependent receptor n=1 Tax=Sphingobium sp. TaxID=1912891 RepID=UPI002ED3690B